MSRFKANTELRFPNAESMPLVTKAGGVSKLKPEDAKKIKWVIVKAGSISEAIPEKSQKWLLKQGHIESVEDAKKRSKK